MTTSTVPEITLLNRMLGKDFATALDRHQALGVKWLDLKDSIFGKSLAELTQPEALAARALIEQRGLEVYTLSSSLCHREVEEGEAAFRSATDAELKRVLDVAAVLRPKSIRLLSAHTSRRAEVADSIDYLDRHHPWIYDVYRDGVDRLSAAGYAVFIENEAFENIFSTVDEILGFFVRLDRTENVTLTYDIQNLWQMGTFPTVAVYDQLRELIGYLHFKGGRAAENGSLLWASALEDASWPVAEIVRRAVAGRIPVFCLNPSHGQHPPGYEPEALAERDLHFLQTLIERA